jgi:hypothetical protein
MKLLAFALCAAPLLAAAQAADPQPDELLQIAFPQWRDEEGGRVQPIKTGAVTRGWDKRQGRQRKVALVPRDVVRVAPDRLVLLAQMTPVDENGVPQLAHGTPVGLAAYTFKPGKDGWKLARRQEPFDLQGFEGKARIEVLPLPEAGHAAHVSWGSCWQGRCVDMVALYRVAKDGVQPKPMLLQKSGGSNLYSRPDCVDRLHGYLAPMAAPDGREEPVAPGRCYAISSGWLIGAGRAGGTPGPLTLSFKGAISRATKEANLPAQPVEQQMKFEFRGGRYVPVAGSNPVPDA